MEGRAYNVSILPKVQQSPRSFYKGTNAKVTPEVIHICDVEGREKEHIDKFESVLKEMKEAEKLKNIKYQLGYSNLTFELFIILHKCACYRSFSDRKQYLFSIQQTFNEKFEDLDYYKQEAVFKRCLEKLTLNDVKSAVRRAAILSEQKKRDGERIVHHSGYSYYRENPALSINEVVQRILEECGVM